MDEERLTPTSQSVAEENPDDSIYAAVDGVYVMSTNERMGAHGKLLEGDIVTAVNGQEIGEMNGLMNAVNDYYVGDTVTVTVWRDGDYLDVNVILMGQKE